MSRFKDFPISSAFVIVDISILSGVCGPFLSKNFNIDRQTSRLLVKDDS